ncbi:MAG: sugar ABC transporter ATP-binding protein [Armatimonadetes bacterium]|nr:sugar ABC transporter ATP-binding protein [Armatimonadota bacterium]
MAALTPGSTGLRRALVPLGYPCPVPSDLLLEVQGLSKAYDGVHALEGVGLQIRPGEVHGLVGENGAGKSTLIKILAGNVVPDSGSVGMAGAGLNLGSVQASLDAGISVIYQELVAFLDLDAVENVFVGREIRRFGIILDRARMRERTSQVFQRLGVGVPLNVPLCDLSVAQRQLVAIARALETECRLLVMDEPTASLSNREVEVLLATVERLKTEGVSVLYVSHRLDEIVRICDSVTVLRDGRVVETMPASSVTRERLIVSMVGRQIAAQSQSAANAPGTVVLEVRGLGRDGAFEDVSFSVRAGEIVGLGGLVGAGRTEVARAIFGLDRIDSGQVLVGGRDVTNRGVLAAVASGVALVPEDRQHEGLVLPLSVKDNLLMAARERLARRGWIQRRAERTKGDELSTRLMVKAASLDVPVRSLSGGNQQKVVIGKWLAMAPRALIMDEPTRGVDVGAKEEVHSLVTRLAAEGAAVLLVSSDLPELLELSDRILVMCEGRVSGELARGEASEEALMALAVHREERAVS